MGSNITPTEKNIIDNYINTVIKRAMSKYNIVSQILIDNVNVTPNGLTYVIDSKKYDDMFKNKLHIIQIIEEENLEYCEEKEIEHLDLSYSTEGLTNTIIVLY